MYNILYFNFLMIKWLGLQFLYVCNLFYTIFSSLHYCLTCLILLQFITFFSPIYNICFLVFWWFGDLVFNSTLMYFFYFFICLTTPLGSIWFCVLCDLHIRSITPLCLQLIVHILFLVTLLFNMFCSSPIFKYIKKIINLMHHSFAPCGRFHHIVSSI